MTRAEIASNRTFAVQSGASFYNGSPCNKCGSRERYTASSNCRACHNTGERKTWKALHYKSRKDRVRDTQLQQKYGINSAEYDRMHEAQEGACGICLETKTSTLHVDHCHTTGEVRGLLCSNCNTALGLLKDNPASIQRALEYIQSAGTIARGAQGADDQLPLVCEERTQD